MLYFVDFYIYIIFYSAKPPRDHHPQTRAGAHQADGHPSGPQIDPQRSPVTAHVKNKRKYRTQPTAAETKQTSHTPPRRPQANPKRHQRADNASLARAPTDPGRPKHTPTNAGHTPTQPPPGNGRPQGGCPTGDLRRCRLAIYIDLCSFPPPTPSPRIESLPKTVFGNVTKTVLVALPNTRGRNVWFRYQKRGRRGNITPKTWKTLVIPHQINLFLVLVPKRVR